MLGWLKNSLPGINSIMIARAVHVKGMGGELFGTPDWTFGEEKPSRIESSDLHRNIPDGIGRRV